MKMYVSIKFDREIEPDKHHISPGEYEMTFDNDKTVRFDFWEFDGIVDPEDKTVLHCRMKGLADYEGTCGFLHNYTGAITEITEFYVFTGSSIELDLHIVPVKLLELELLNDNCESIGIADEVLAGAGITSY